jgi:hypothetical protein
MTLADSDGDGLPVLKEIHLIEAGAFGWSSERQL